MLYAAGYKIGKNGFSIQRTGMFIIDSQPKGAKIFIDGRAQKTFYSLLARNDNFITTPAKIKNILPGEYMVSLELEGYWNWKKKLTVYPGASTFAEDIYLFKNDLPVQILTAKKTKISYSPDKTLALAIKENGFTLFNLTEATEKSVEEKNISGENIAWADDNSQIVVDGLLYNLGNLANKVDFKKISSNFSNFKWSDGFLYFQDKNSIYRLNYQNYPDKIAADKKFNDYLIKDNYLYLVNKAKQTTNLEVIDLSDGQNKKTISLPDSGNYSFVNQKHSLINLFNHERSSLYLIDWQAYSPVMETINNLKSSYWANDNTLAYFNDLEIWLYNANNKTKTLITRISDTINNAVVHPSKNYIIYSTEKTINVIELDERGNRNVVELVKFDSIDSLLLSAKGDVIYFYGKVGNLVGLYKTLIQ